MNKFNFLILRGCITEDRNYLLELTKEFNRILEEAEKENKNYREIEINLATPNKKYVEILEREIICLLDYKAGRIRFGKTKGYWFFPKSWEWSLDFIQHFHNYFDNRF